MQQLIFESAWDKTIAPIDRETITRIFHETKDEPQERIQFIPIRQAINHQGSLLVTVLIHNFTVDTAFPLHNIRLTYKENDQLVAEHVFSHPLVNVMERTSTPWTFIFPNSSLEKEPSLQNGKLHMIRN